MLGSSHCCDCLAPTEVVWRWGGGGGWGFKTKKARQRKSKLKMVSGGGGYGTFVHLKENGERKKAEFRGELPIASVKCLE